MKKALLLLPITLLFYACPPMPYHVYDKVEYKAITRGSSESIVIEIGNKIRADLLYSKNSSEKEKRNLSKKESLELFDILRYIDLSQIDQLEVPSKKHQYDGALVTTIEITTKGGTYRSVTFDHDNPPKELKSLTDYLLSLTQ